jgi:hypothetical protein
VDVDLGGLARQGHDLAVVGVRLGVRRGVVRVLDDVGGLEHDGAAVGRVVRDDAAQPAPVAVPAAVGVLERVADAVLQRLDAADDALDPGRGTEPLRRASAGRAGRDEAVVRGLQVLGVGGAVAPALLEHRLGSLEALGRQDHRVGVRRHRGERAVEQLALGDVLLAVGALRRRDGLLDDERERSPCGCGPR